MRWFLIFASSLCIVTGYSLKRNGPKCYATDLKCVAVIVSDVFVASLPGVDALGVVSLDPIHHQLVEVDKNTIKYSFTDSVVKGYKNAKLNNVKIQATKSILFDFTLPYFEVSGHYKMSGSVSKKPVESEGKYYINATELHLQVNATKEFYENNGVRHLKLTNLKTTLEPLGVVNFKADNLLNGNKASPDSILKFWTENPKEVVKEWDSFISSANTKIVIDDFNKILATVPLNDLIFSDGY